MTVPKVDVEQRISNIEDALSRLIDVVADQGKKVEAAQSAGAEKKGIFGGKRGRVAIKDTKTGATYASQAQVTKKLAAEFSLDPLDHFACYKIFAKEPTRFIRLSGAEAEAVWKADDERVEAEVDAANKKLQEEQALADAKAAAATKATAEKAAGKKGK